MARPSRSDRRRVVLSAVVHQDVRAGRLEPVALQERVTTQGVELRHGGEHRLPRDLCKRHDRHRTGGRRQLTASWQSRRDSGAKSVRKCPAAGHVPVRVTVTTLMTCGVVGPQGIEP